MDKIFEALKNVIPEDSVEGVTEAIKEMIAESRKEIETEYESKLEEAYTQLAEEKKQDEEKAYQGYQEATSIIEDLRARLEKQQNEFDLHMEQEFEEAFQMLQEERAKNETLELELYEQYEGKLKEMQEFFVEKIHDFFLAKGTEIYEQARREVVNDPRLAEHKVALDKVVETVSSYISNDDYAVVTNKKIEELAKANEELRGQIRIVESRNIRLSTDRDKLNEQVRQMNNVINESKVNSTKNNKKEREEKAKNVQGRGNIVTEERIINEVADENPSKEQPNANRAFVESINPTDLENMKKLAGLGK